MAAKTQDIAQRVSSPEQFVSKLAEPGVKVVEVFSEWAGPCACLQSTYKTLRVQNGDAGRPEDALQFLAVCAEQGGAVAEVTSHNGRSEPLFLVYKNGVRKARVEGADPETLAKGVHAALAAPGDDDPEQNPFRGQATQQAAPGAARK